MTEIWKDIIYDGVIYEGYQASNLGKVISLNYKNTGKSKILKPWNLKGYLQIALKDKKFLVHQLIASTFLPNPENKPEVNHIDEDKTNNFVGTPENDFRDGNLEWIWHKDNCNHGTRNKRIGEKMTNGKTSKIVLQYSLNGDLIREWISVREIERQLGYNVSKCCRGEYKQSHGFKWEYKKEVV